MNGESIFGEKQYDMYTRGDGKERRAPDNEDETGEEIATPPEERQRFAMTGPGAGGAALLAMMGRVSGSLGAESSFARVETKNGWGKGYFVGMMKTGWPRPG